MVTYDCGMGVSVSVFEGEGAYDVRTSVISNKMASDSVKTPANAMEALV